MMVEDWRNAPEAVVGPLYRAECERWRAGLDWDLHLSCRIIEEGRRRGGVPGFLARDAGQVVGWMFYVLHGATFEIGGLVGASEHVIHGLLRAALRTAEARWARRAHGFLFADGEGAARQLAAAGFSVEPHLYLRRPIAREDAFAWSTGLPGRFPVTVRPLDRLDLPALVGVTRRAYAGAPEASCFAPDDRPDQWAAYVAQLLQTPGCGIYLPQASFVLEPTGTGGDVHGAVITTRISETTAHIAQVVVEPELRGGGLGRLLLSRACAAAAGAGCRDVSLIVAQANLAARGLYRRLGFGEIGASFLFGSKRLSNHLRRRVRESSQPLRSTMDALGTGGAITLR